MPWRKNANTQRKELRNQIILTFYNPHPQTVSNRLGISDNKPKGMCIMEPCWERFINTLIYEYKQCIWDICICSVSILTSLFSTIFEWNKQFDLIQDQSYSQNRFPSSVYWQHVSIETKQLTHDWSQLTHDWSLSYIKAFHKSKRLFYPAELN